MLTTTLWSFPLFPDGSLPAMYFDSGKKANFPQQSARIGYNITVLSLRLLFMELVTGCAARDDGTETR